MVKNKLRDWFFYAIIVGLLPLAFKLIVCLFVDVELTLSDFFLEVYCFSLALATNGLQGTLKLKYEMRKYKIFRAFFLVVISAVIFFQAALYFTLLLDSYKCFIDNWTRIAHSAIALVGGSIISCFIVECLGGKQNA